MEHLTNGLDLRYTATSLKIRMRMWEQNAIRFQASIETAITETEGENMQGATTKFDLSMFNKMVKGISGKYQKDCLHDSDDVEQDLWMKLIEITPRLLSMKRREMFAFAKASLQNEVRDIQRRSIVRAPLNQKLRSRDGAFLQSEDWAGSSMEDLMDRAICGIDQYIPQHLLSAHDVLAYKKLVTDLREWSNNESGLSRQIVEGMVNPSPEMLDKWAAMADQNPHYKMFDLIPPTTFAKLFGVSKLRVHRTVKKMRTFLVDMGYRQELTAACN